MRLFSGLRHLSIFIVLFASCSLAQRDVPDAVRTTFQAKYPGEDDPDWHRDDHGNFEAHFKTDGRHLRADFNPDGSWIETEESIDKDDLPKAVRDWIEAEHENDDITEIERVEHHSKGLFFDIEFKRKGKNLDVEVRENGTVIR